MTTADHHAATAALRRQRLQVVGSPNGAKPGIETRIEVRCLDDYDTALGIDLGPDQAAQPDARGEDHQPGPDRPTRSRS